jgi:hypothetical protein
MPLAVSTVAASASRRSPAAHPLHPFVRSLAVALLLVCVAASAARAADKYAGAFLHIGAGARAVGMGGAFAALANDASAAYWNPAGIVLLNSRQVLFQHVWQFGSLASYDYGSFVWPLTDSSEARRQAVAVSLVRLGVSDIPITPEIGALVPGDDYEDANHNGAWDPGERLFLSPDDPRFHTESANDWALFFTYGRTLTGRLNAGASLKLLYRTLPGYSGSHTAWGAGLDAGLTFAAAPHLTLAAVAHDFTTTYMSWDTGTREQVSPSFDVGAQYTRSLAARHALTVALDVPFNFDGYSADQFFGVRLAVGADGLPRDRFGVSGTVHAGAEYWYNRMLALRAGIMGRDLTFGTGFRYKRVGADYAAVFSRVFASNPQGFTGDANLDVTHRISGSYNF